MYDIILFDLDGTLTDPKIGITRCVQYALEKLGIIEDDLEALVHFIGPPLMLTFKEHYHLTDEQARQALAYYRERFSTVGLYENAVFPGIPELLDSLVKEGKTLFVATSKPTVYSVRILEHFGLQGYFQAIIGSNLDGTRVEKFEVIEYLLSQLGDHDRRKVLMVGDRKHDVIGARKHNIAVAAVGYGYGTAEELTGADPDYLVQTVQELEKLLLSLSACPDRQS